MISPEQWDRFFGNFATTGIVKLACACSGIGRRTVYDHLETGTDEWKARFKAAEAEAVDTLEGEGFRRAVEGVKRPQFTKGGKPIYMPADPSNPTAQRVHYLETTYSDQLLMFLLRARNPSKFKDRVANELTGKDGGPIQTETKVIVMPAIPDEAPE